MKERPILFSAPMVRALLAGTKTQTRRAANSQPPHRANLLRVEDGVAYFCDGEHEKCDRCEEHEYGIACPHGKPGDRLWVKETWRPHVAHWCAMGGCDCADVNVDYAADGASKYVDDYTINRASPDWCMPKAADRGNVSPLFMPRWASRLVLEITDVRIERLNVITEEDAKAEGTSPSIVGADLQYLAYRAGFQTLWESINGKDSWYEDPWVWALTFRRVEAQ